jgi:hypothetical protein
MKCPLITLGFHCNITFLIQSLCIKYETGLFEWIQSEKLEYITDIVNNIKDNIDTNIIKGVDKNIYIIHKKVFTFHYHLEEYKIIFKRRAQRFLNLIKESNELLFVRINPMGPYTTEEEINNFVKTIHTINSKVNIKFLMIHTIDRSTDYKRLDESKFSNITFLQKEILFEDCPEGYLRNNKKIQQQFLEFLKEIDVHIEPNTNIKFIDKS